MVDATFIVVNDNRRSPLSSISNRFRLFDSHFETQPKPDSAKMKEKK